MRAKSLQEMKEKSRIAIKDGCVLIGGKHIKKGRPLVSYLFASGLDESFVLKYGECFVQITDPATNERKVIEGPVCSHTL
jgi:hypothetical protein